MKANSEVPVRQERRMKLINSLAAPAVILIYAGNAPMRSADEKYPFSVERNFFYFTGLDSEDMVLMLKKDVKGKVTEQLYLRPYDEELAKWVGGRMKKEEAGAVSGIDEICYLEELDEGIHNFLRNQRGNGTTLLGLDLWRYEKDQADTKAHKMASYIKEQFPAVEIRDVYSACAGQRTIKSPEEISSMKMAQETTRTAVEKVLRYAEAGMNEGELEGCFDFGLRCQGVKEHAFPSIVAGGKNAVVLHYQDNDQTVQNGDMVLLDLGSAHNHYCADISRTFPVNGTFTQRQRELYDIVLNAQELVISHIKPGITLKELNNLVIEFYEERLKACGLLKEGKTVKDYYYHGVSHHLGLDAHDISNEAAEALRPGMVITVEPGLYVEEEGIGIRIEDDILVTETGAENLSKAILKEADDIEKMMQERDR